MFRLIKLSMEGLVTLSVLAFLALWVVLQEYGTILIWAAIIFGVVKLLQYLTKLREPAPVAKPTVIHHYPRHGVSEPVVIDRKLWVTKPLDGDQRN